MSKVPFLDREVLIKEIKNFACQYNAYFKSQTKRMSDFYEMSAYNEIVRYYKKKKYDIRPFILKKGKFKYRLSTSGLKENFSYFHCSKIWGRGANKPSIAIEIHHNLRIQSNHDDKMFYNADISVCFVDGVDTDRFNQRRRDYICKDALITFFEVKNLTPFPEILYNFNGLLLEFMSEFIYQNVITSEFNPNSPVNQNHLCPGIFFSGNLNDNTRKIVRNLQGRYKHNIICGLANSKGKIPSLRNLMEYELPSAGG